VVALECKWTAEGFDPTNLLSFRRQHPDGENILVAADVSRGFSRTVGGLAVRCESLGSFVNTLK
jgi:hypothetical protein